MVHDPPVVNATALPLDSALREATSALHRELERSPFMSRMLAGQLQSGEYLRWLDCLVLVYGALERGLQANAAHPVLAPFIRLGICRLPALEEDLAYWQHRPHAAVAPAAAALAYANRLRTVAADEPELLLAHAYVRYLGDLSGGQPLRRAVAGMPDSAGGAGTAFYDFGSRPEVQALAEQLRAALRQAGTVATALGCFGSIVAEAVSAFRRHGELFAELGVVR